MMELNCFISLALSMESKNRQYATVWPGHYTSTQLSLVLVARSLIMHVSCVVQVPKARGAQSGQIHLDCKVPASFMACSASLYFSRPF